MNTKELLLAQIKNISITRIIIAVIIVIAIVSSVYNFYREPNVVTKTEYVRVPEEKQVTKIERVNVPGPKEVVTIEKEKIVKVLQMPSWFKQDKNEQAIANADLAPSKNGYSAVATINTQNGNGAIIAKEKSRSLIGLPSEKEVGARYGITSRGVQEAQAYGRWQFLRVGDVYVGAYGEVGSKPEAKAMIDMSYKW